MNKLLIKQHVFASGKALEAGTVVSDLSKGDTEVLLAMGVATADEAQIAAAEASAAKAKSKAA